MALTTLKPRIVCAPSKLKHATANPSATPRMRGRAWMDRRAAWLRANPLCAHCTEQGQTIVATQVDHIIPLWNGGADDESNYQSLCVPHHDAKTAAEAKERAGR